MADPFPPAPQSFGTLSPYTPSLRERLIGAMQNAVGGTADQRGTASDFAENAGNVLGMVPGVSNVLGADDAVRQYQGGHPIQAALTGAMALPIPGAGMAEEAAEGPAQKLTQALIKRLPESNSLNLPDAPTAAQMAQHGRVESVPLSQVRATQSTMGGDSPGDLIPGYGNMPVAGRREDGEYLVFDGHHRAVEAMNQGQDSLPMHVINVRDYAPQFAGRPPAPPFMSDDELLNALTAPFPRPPG